MTETCAIALTINGREHRLSVAPSLTLADLLRDVPAGERTLIESADGALYQAKAAGKAQFVLS